MAEDLGGVSPGLITAHLTGEQVWSWTRLFHPALKEHMHALGVVAANYNDLEFILLMIFSHYFSPRPTASTVVFYHLSNQYRLDALRAALDDAELNATNKELALHFLNGFDVCAENRNFLMHSMVERALSEPEKALAPTLILRKPARKDPMRLNEAQLDLKQIRKIADEIAEYYIFGFQLFDWLRAPLTGGKITYAEGEEYTPTLPERPPPPNKLNLLSDPNRPAA